MPNYKYHCIPCKEDSERTDIKVEDRDRQACNRCRHALDRRVDLEGPMSTGPANR